MNILIEWFGLDPDQFNEVAMNMAAKDLSLVWILALVVAPLALWFFWTSLKRIQSPIRKIFLIAFRVLTFAVLVFMLLKPELEFKKSHTLKNSIAVLLDDTKSMSIKTFPSETPRIDFVRRTFEKNRNMLESLKEKFQVDYYFASSKISPTSYAELGNRYQPKKAITDLENTFSQLRKRYEGKSLQGVMLFSDGADLAVEPETVSPEMLALLADWEGPVHTFQAGSNEMFKDLAIEELDSVDFGFIHQPVRLTVTISASNMGNKNIPLVLKEGDTILLSRIVEVREGQNQYPVEMEFTPGALGKRIYTLTVPHFAGESVATNNRRDFQVKVIRDRIRVLHLNGRPAWDSRFLREVLANHPKVDLLSFFILRTMGDDVASPTSELSLIPFPTNLLFSDYLNSFDLIVFQNFSYEPFIDKKYLHNINNYVKQGGAFMMVGGELSFQGGGYERTAIEAILPVQLERTSQPFIGESFHLQRGKSLLRHPILQLEKESSANAKAWQDLPELNGVNAGLKPRKNAHVLAEFDKGNKNYPVLVAGRVGEGRSIVVATDSAWNWNFRRVGEGGSGRHYYKFWNNLIAWLTDDPATRLLQLETDKERYEEGEDTLLRIRVLQEDYNPSIGTEVNLTIKSREGEEITETIKTDDNGEAAHQWTPQREGFYTVKVKVDVAGDKREADVGFSVFSETAEFQKPKVNETLLKRIAEVSGGRYEVLTEKTDLSAIKFPNPKVEVKTHSKSISLWDNWWTYGLILTFLFLDWFTRRKSGLS